MESITLTQQIDVMRRRIGALYQSASTTSERELLPRAFEELQLAIEELQTAEEHLRGQHEEMLASVDQIEQDRLRYQDLFEQAPIGYLITSLDATIRQANYTAQQLLGAPEKFLVGRSLALFVPTGGRRPFRDRVLELRHCQQPQRWLNEFAPWQGHPQMVELTAACIQTPQGRTTGLRWLLQLHEGQSDQTEQLRRRIAELEQQLSDQQQRFSLLSQHLANMTRQIEAISGPLSREIG